MPLNSMFLFWHNNLREFTNWVIACHRYHHYQCLVLCLVNLILILIAMMIMMVVMFLFFKHVLLLLWLVINKPSTLMVKCSAAGPHSGRRGATGDGQGGWESGGIQIIYVYNVLQCFILQTIQMKPMLWVGYGLSSIYIYTYCIIYRVCLFFLQKDRKVKSH